MHITKCDLESFYRVLTGSHHTKNKLIAPFKIILYTYIQLRKSQKSQANDIIYPRYIWFYRAHDMKNWSWVVASVLIISSHWVRTQCNKSMRQTWPACSITIWQIWIDEKYRFWSTQVKTLLQWKKISIVYSVQQFRSQFTKNFLTTEGLAWYLTGLKVLKKMLMNHIMEWASLIKFSKPRQCRYQLVICIYVYVSYISRYIVLYT